MRRTIVVFAGIIYPGALLAQTLAPAADVGSSWWLPIVTGLVGVGLGIAIKSYLVKNPAALPTAETDLLAMLNSANESIHTLAAKIEAARVAEVAKTEATIANLQAKLPPKP